MLAIKRTGAANIRVHQIPLVKRIVDECRDRPDCVSRLKRQLEVGSNVVIRNGLRRKGQVRLLFTAIRCISKERQIEITNLKDLLQGLKSA